MRSIGLMLGGIVGILFVSGGIGAGAGAGAFGIGAFGGIFSGTVGLSFAGAGDSVFSGNVLFGFNGDTGEVEAGPARQKFGFTHEFEFSNEGIDVFAEVNPVVGSDFCGASAAEFVVVDEGAVDETKNLGAVDGGAHAGKLGFADVV